MYAVYQSGYAIYGVGETREEAIARAARFLDADTDLSSIHEATQRGEVYGDLYIRTCSATLAEAVNTEGGDQLYEINEDDVLVLTSELD